MSCRALGVMLSLTACGRVGFDATGDGSGQSAGDAGFFGAARCPADVLLCDSFEADVIDASLWNQSLQYAGLTLDTTRAARGNQSLHASGNATPNFVQAELVHDDTALLPNPVYLRVFVYATQFAPGGDEVWAWLFGGPDGVQVEGGPSGQLGYGGWGISGSYAGSTTAIPVDRWVCLEWLLEPGRMSIWMDDVPVADLQGTSWTTPPAPEQLAIGLQYQTSPGTAVDDWIDEVIADGSRIGCSK